MKKEENLRQVMKFAAVGLSNFLIFSLVIWFMMDVCGEGMIVSNVTAYAIAWVNFFVWNRVWVFKPARGHVARELFLNLAAYLSAYLLQLGFTYLLVARAGMDEILAQYYGLLVFGTANFLLNKKLVFKQRNAVCDITAVQRGSRHRS